MGTIRDTVSDMARDRGEFPQFSPEVDLAPLADATETAISTAVAAVTFEAFEAEDIGYDNTDSELTADNAQAAIDEVVVRVEALEDAPPPAASAVNFVATQTVDNGEGGADDYDFLFAGAPASLPTQAEFFIANIPVYGNVYVRMVGDVVYGDFDNVNMGRPAAVVGLERIAGGVRFKGGAVWSLSESAGMIDPFNGKALTIAASF